MSNKLDFVVTWVDGADKEWQKQRAMWAKKEQGADSELFKKWINNDIRFRDWGLLKYWFRAVDKYASWVNKVYLVTCGQTPNWINTKNEKLILVNHEDFIPKKYLPTFNSNAIELNLHKIKGLSENFVYFNDDMFLTKMTKPEDFFDNNKPKQTAGLDCVNLDLYITHAEINNVKILNKHFDKKKVLKNNINKWINLKYGKNLLKTIALIPWQRFTGIQEYHACIPYKKETFKQVWRAEPDLLEQTLKSKFRNDTNVNHWLMENWQLLNGGFIPVNPKRYWHIEEQITPKIADKIFSNAYTCVCINDVECTEDQFEKQKIIIQQKFQEIFPDKSSFEK